MNRVVLVAAAFAAAALAASCASPESSGTPGTAPRSAALAASDAMTAEELARGGEGHGIHNLGRAAPGLFRGAQPEGEEAFRYLASLGVKTILTVDGARPEVALAAKHGIRYIHVPIGYSGITQEDAARIAKVGAAHGDGLFVHCHHGKHRGPAAMGVVWMARDGVSPERVKEEMKRAGTDPKYQGLWAAQDSCAAVALSKEILAGVTEADLPSTAPVQGVTESMVHVDFSWVNMGKVKKAGWRSPPESPDVQPAHEARILAEHFRELARLDEVKGRPEDFRRWLTESEVASWDMEKALRAGDTEGAGRHFERVRQACADCHAVYRDAPLK
jgi:protein tyrosine phosphatase (PTP) superfamily phosphohydrolase (DUF442 family)